MQIHIAGKGIEVGSALMEHAETRLKENINKYLDRVTDVNVVFSKEKTHLFRAQIIVTPGTHADIIIKAHADYADVYAAFDSAAEKVEKQLRRYKSKLKDHHRDASIKVPMQQEVKSYILSSHDKEEEVQDEANALVIAEATESIETLTVSEAVMRMDLGHLPMVMFYSTVHGGLNVLYRRDDGNIAWVDPGSPDEARSEYIKKAS